MEVPFWSFAAMEANYPAVIVESVPSARSEQGYTAQVLVYSDETYMVQKRVET